METKCPSGLVLIDDRRKINSTGITQALTPRKIPRIIHMTSKSRCVVPALAKVINTWKQYPDHQFYFHNDAALHRLIFEKQWSEFPQIRLAMECSNSMVEQADLWRALVIWEYGGIYTDIDNLPKGFNATTTLQASDEAYFEVERGGWLSQYFFAAEPKHPLMYLLVMQIWQRIFGLPDIADQYAPYLTGPGALKIAMKHFMQTHTMQVGKGIHPHEVFEKVRDGHYVGLANKSVTVAPKASAVSRSVLRRKGLLYEAMNMTHFHSTERKSSNVSCLNHLLMNFLSQRNEYEFKVAQSVD